jgi:glycosyltransferase involved in cell wall biosynthesis
VKKILWVGDAACDSGFAKATHEILAVVKEKFDVAVLGLNYRGDPHDYPYPIYPAFVPGNGMDLFGVNRLPSIIVKEKPDLIVFQNDPWNIPAYMATLADLPKEVRPIMVGHIAVDGKNCRGRDIQALDHVVFWTQFAADEATQGGYTKSSTVIPLGIDLNVFKPPTRPKQELRQLLGLPKFTHDGFFFLNVNRNQPRKRLDLTMQAFAHFREDWLESAEEGPEPFLYLHVCPTGDQGYDLEQLAGYYGLHQKIIIAEPGVYHGSSIAELVATYQAADAMITTTQGEGWGLPTMEGMAVGLPQIAPDWSALGEWARDAARLIPCAATIATPRVNSIGGVVNPQFIADAMFDVYHDAEMRRQMIEAGFKVAARPEYHWNNIGLRWVDVLTEALDGKRSTFQRWRGVPSAAKSQAKLPRGSRSSAVSGD